MKVVKFGGSSLSCAENFRRVKEIVEGDPARRVVVVSAPGKRSPGDNKVTDLLYICHAHLRYQVSFDDIWENIAGRYREIAAGCGLSLPLDDILQATRDAMTREASEDAIVSRGEYLCARLMAEYLGYDFVDAAEWLHFSYDGTVDYEATYASLRELAAGHPCMVLPGFYGTLPDGRLHVFSRGGSDVTGALAAAALSAESYENWTDVSGILMADPRIVENPRPIERVTFGELRELSFMGAEVLHEETVFPVRQAGIPLYIKNTHDPAAPGTLIMERFEEEREEEDSRFITGIAGKRHYTVVTVRKNRANGDASVIRRVLELAEKYRLPIEHIPSGVDSFSLVIPTRALGQCLHSFISEIQKECTPDGVHVSEGVSLIAIVGRRMAATTGVSGKIFARMGQIGVNIRLIEQDSDEVSIIIGVMDEDFAEAVRTLYNSFT